MSSVPGTKPGVGKVDFVCLCVCVCVSFFTCIVVKNVFWLRCTKMDTNSVQIRIRKPNGKKQRLPTPLGYINITYASI